jgi:hypothetical protein
VLYLVKYLKQSHTRHLLFAGVVLALSAYVRPVSYFLPALIAAGLAIGVWMRPRPHLMLNLDVLLFLFVSTGLLVLWQWRNYVIAGYPGFSGIEEIDFYFYDAAAVLAHERGISYSNQQQSMGYLNHYFDLHPEQRSWSLPRRLKYMKSQAEAILLSHPLVYARIHLEGIGLTLLDPGAVEYLQTLGRYQKAGPREQRLDKSALATVSSLATERPLLFWSSLILLLLELLYLVGALVSVFLCSRVTAILAVGLVICYFIIITGGPAGYNRFRQPITPLLSGLAGYGLLRLWRLTPYKPCLFARNADLNSPSSDSSLAPI